MQEITRENNLNTSSPPTGDGARPVFNEDEAFLTSSKMQSFRDEFTPMGDGAHRAPKKIPEFLDVDKDSNSGSPRKASSELKERYKAETEFLRQKLGTLENIRRELGLSQRKVSELLLVDPASWHRWAKQNRAPSYIYKSLQWFLALRDRNPELASLQWMKTHSSERENLYLEDRIEQISREVARLKIGVDKSPSALRGRNSLAPIGFIALGVAIGFALCYWLLRVF